MTGSNIVNVRRLAPEFKKNISPCPACQGFDIGVATHDLDGGIRLNLFCDAYSFECPYSLKTHYSATLQGAIEFWNKAHALVMRTRKKNCRVYRNKKRNEKRND